MSQKTRKIFITGGFGYLGSLLAQKVLSKGWQVMIFDSLLYQQNYKKISEEIKGSNKKSWMDYVLGDTRNKSAVLKSIKKYNPDIVLHFGELVGVYACEKNLKLTRSVNYIGSKNVIGVCVALDTPLLYNSSSSVYGNKGEGKFMKETDLLPKPTDEYCKNKILIEKHIKDVLNKKRGWRAIIFRPATVCGPAPRMRLELLPNHFTYSAANKGIIRLAQPNASRAMMDIGDLTDAYVRVIDGMKWEKLIYNIGHYNWSKIKYTKVIQKETGCKIVISKEVGDSRNLGVDDSVFRKEFRWRPKKSFAESVKNIMKWVKIYGKASEKMKYAGVINMPLKIWRFII
jgi:nucleoside-diphosphate-sugar epimerase